MFRTFLLIFLLCGLTVFSVLTEDRTSAETYACQPLRMCLPETPPPCETIPCAPSVQPLECEMPACSAIPHPLVYHRCAFVAKTDDRTRDAKSRSVSATRDRRHAMSMVFTSDVMRAMSR